MEKYRLKIEDVKKNENWFRLGKAFRTKNNFYILDTGTGKVFKTKESIYRILDCLFKTNNFDNLYKIDLPRELMENSLEEIFEIMQSKKLFSAPPITMDAIICEHTRLEDKLHKDMTAITLELTEECNLRCSYCLYGNTNEEYRSFGKKNESVHLKIYSI